VRIFGELTHSFHHAMGSSWGLLVEQEGEAVHMEEEILQRCSNDLDCRRPSPRQEGCLLEDHQTYSTIDLLSLVHSL
jgi:hypothetical protein